MTPRWKIRRGYDGMWVVLRSFEKDGKTYYVPVGEYHRWENAIVHTEIGF